jgi:hypothetical protein
MLKRHTICASLFLLILSVINAQAQGDIAKSATPDALTITAAASDERVRYTAPASIVQIRLEVYASTGKKVFDNELRGGNVLDWHLQNGQAEPLLDDTYLCVVTVKNLSGKITQRIGAVRVDKGVASLQPAATAQMSAQQSDAVGPVEENAALTILTDGETQTGTVIAHDGTDGQLIRGRGALSFRLGDFFSGTDREQMRLTADGNLGIGTSDPKVKLDVAGMIGARDGVMFSDGSTLTVNKNGSLTHHTSGGDVSPSIAGTGTTNQITKWSNGASGVVADSALSESGGNLGLGTTAPDSIFHLSGPGGVNALTFDTPGTARGRFGSLAGVPDWLGMFLNGTFSGSGWLLDNTARTGWFFKLDNRAGFDEFAVYKIPPGAGPHSDEFPRFVLRSSGGGGMGTMPLGYTPASTLDVVSDGSLDVLQWRGTAAGGALGAIKANGRVGIGTTGPQQNLSVNGAVNVDQSDANNGTVNPGITFGSNSGEGISSKRTAAGGNQFGLSFFTNQINRINILNNGNVGIGTATAGFVLDVGNRMRVRQGTDGDAGMWLFQTTPNSDRAFVGMKDDTHVGFFGNTGAGWGLTMDTTSGTIGHRAGISVDDALANNGGLTPGITFGGTGSGEGISSRRTAGGNQFGLDLFTGFASRISISNLGIVSIGATSPGAKVYVEANGVGVVRGKNTGTTGTAATFEITNAGNGNNALFASSLGTGPAVVGSGLGNGDGVYGFSSGGYAGNFLGKVNVSDTVYAVNLQVSGTKNFRIDHPLDPANKYLLHASIESSEVKNLYDGVVEFDQNGQAVVSLPGWFEILNRDFRYQLTCIGGYAQVYVAEEIANNRFKIAGGKPGMKVSWQVTGNRQDPFIKANPMQVEEAKPEIERGFYLHPELYGEPEERGIEWARRAEQMRLMKEHGGKLIPKE